MKPTKNINVGVTKEMMDDIKKLQAKHKETTGYDITIPAIIRSALEQLLEKEL